MTEKNIFEQIENTSFYRYLKYGMNRRLIRFFRENVFENRKALKVAEIACGSGYGSHLIAKQAEVTLSLASDISMKLSNQSSIPEFSATFVTADIFNLPFKTDSFDLVWNSSSLEHFDVPEDALLSMARIVKPGGFVFVGVPYLYGPLALYYLSPLKKWREWLGRPYTFNELEKMFTSCELRPQKHVVYFTRFFAGILAEK